MAEKSNAIKRLIDCFGGLPGIGKKSAERLTYHVLRSPQDEALGFADAIRAVKENLRPCKICFNLTEEDACSICQDSRRDQELLCVVEQVQDLFALEQAGTYRGVYHVLQGRVSPLEGVGPEKLTIEALVERVRTGRFREVIMGTTPNVEGDGTCLLIADRLSGLPVVLSRLARGLTAGASLEQANRDMLADALTSRQKL